MFPFISPYLAVRSRRQPAVPVEDAEESPSLRTAVSLIKCAPNHFHQSAANPIMKIKVISGNPGTTEAK